MRMGDRDRAEPAFGRHAVDQPVVEIRDAVPEHVAGAALHEQRPLADRERGLAADAENAVVVSHVGLVAVEELLPRHPDLAGGVRDVLTWVLTDRTGRWRLVRRRIVRCAGLAEIRRHAVARSRRATHSTCGVWGNMSTGRARV